MWSVQHLHSSSHLFIWVCMMHLKVRLTKRSPNINLNIQKIDWDCLCKLVSIKVSNFSNKGQMTLIFRSDVHRGRCRLLAVDFLVLKDF